MRIIGIVGLLIGLTACASWHSADRNKAAICKELNYQIVVNGATPNQAEAMQQRTGLDKLNQAYIQNGC